MLELVGPSGEEIVDGIAAGAVSAYGGLVSARRCRFDTAAAVASRQTATFDVTTDGLFARFCQHLASASVKLARWHPKMPLGFCHLTKKAGGCASYRRSLLRGTRRRSSLFHASKKSARLSRKWQESRCFLPFRIQHASPFATLASGLRIAVAGGPKRYGLDGSTAAVAGPWLAAFLYGTRSAPRLVALPRPALRRRRCGGC